MAGSGERRVIPRRRLLDRTVQEGDARLYFLVVEGEKTEPCYFYEMENENHVPLNLVNIQLYSPDGHASAPIYLIGKAEDVAKKMVIGAGHEIWLVFDVDRQSGSTRIGQIIQSVEDAVQRG